MNQKIANLVDDYIKVMPKITDESDDSVMFDADLMGTDFEKIKNDKKSIEAVREKLITYAEQAPNAPAHYDAIASLLYRMDALLG